jgi:hypothetical protein
MEDNGEESIRPLTHIDLARMYNVDRRTLTKWMRPHREAIGRKIGFYYTIRQVLTIFRVIGAPEGFEKYDSSGL